MNSSAGRGWFRSSLSQQLVVATVLAVLPLVMAVVYATWSLGQQTRLQHELVQGMAALNQLDASVSEQVKDLERSARQLRLLREPRFRELYMQRLEQLRRNQQRLSELSPRDSERETLATLVALMSAVGDRLDQNSATTGEPGDLAPDFQRAYALSLRLSEQVDAHLATALAEGEAQFDAIAWRLFLIGVLAIPGTVLLVVIGCIAIYGPIRRLSEAIRRLGHRQWQEPVAINGPSDLIELGERLEWMRLELLAAERQKEAFLRHVTHELNSPLAAIMEATALLGDKVPGDLTEAQMRVLNIMQRNVDSLQKLIQQLLNYNAVIRGIDRNTQNVDLKAMCAALTARFEDIARENNIVWRLDGPSATVPADPLVLEMILSNLFSNAFHFSPADSEIDVSWRIEDHRWWLSITDHGPGIDGCEQADIFRPFYQGRNKRRGATKGSGVGLAIVQECTRALGGEVRVDSAPGAGSRFHLEFPTEAEGDQQ